MDSNVKGNSDGKGALGNLNLRRCSDVRGNAVDSVLRGSLLNKVPFTSESMEHPLNMRSPYIIALM